jgi:hypothetical protein
VGDSSTEREFPADKVYRREDRGIVGVEPFRPHSLGLFSVHTVLDVRRGLTVPAGLDERRNKNTSSGLLTTVALLSGTIERQPVAPIPWGHSKGEEIMTFLRIIPRTNPPGMVIDVAEEATGILLSWRNYTGEPINVELSVADVEPTTVGMCW